MKKIPLTKPYIPPEVKDRVLQVLDSGYLTEGLVTKEFENSVKDYIGCEHALAVSNCTVGLEIALRTLGIGQGDEVIVPDYTYPATAAVVGIVGATIVLVDVDPETMLIDYRAIEAAVTERTKVIIPVSLFGNPLDYDRLGNMKKKYNLYLIEDAACAIGAQYDGDFVGNLADISVFSFHPRKFITTGEGGMITTNNSGWAAWMESYKHFGMSSASPRSEIHFERIGTNYKLSDVHAAIGLVQMRQIASLLEKRTQLANRYNELLSNQPNVSIPKITPKGIHSWQSFCIFTPNRDQVIQKLAAINIETQIGTYALHMHHAYSRNPNCRIFGDLSGSQYAFDSCLTLPLYQDMTPDQQEFVAKELLHLIHEKQNK